MDRAKLQTLNGSCRLSPGDGDGLLCVVALGTHKAPWDPVFRGRDIYVAEGVQPDPEGGIAADVRPRPRVDLHLHSNELLIDFAPHRVAHDVVHHHVRSGCRDRDGVAAPTTDPEAAYAAVADVHTQEERLHVELGVLHAHLTVRVSRLQTVGKLGVDGGGVRQALGRAEDLQRGHGGGHDFVVGGVRAQDEVGDERGDAECDDGEN